MKRIVILLIAFSVSQSVSFAQESKFKALFIYKFAEYVEWPSASQKLVVGVAGESGVFKELTNFASTKENFDVIKVGAPSDATKCNILFLPKKQSEQIDSFKSVVGTTSVLIVSETGKLTGKGADIGFYVEGGKLKFMISEKDIRAKNMIPGSKLLSLGKPI